VRAEVCLGLGLTIRDAVLARADEVIE